MGLRTKLFLPLLVLSAVIGVFLLAFWSPRFVAHEERMHERHYRMQLAILAQSMGEDATHGDWGEIYANTRAIMHRYDTWKRVEIYAANGKRLYPHGPVGTAPSGRDIHVAQQPISDDGHRFGRVVLWFDLGPALRGTRLAVEHLDALLLVSFLAAMLLAGLLVELMVRRPAKDLAVAAEALGRGNFSHDLPISRADEIGELTRHFGAMRDNVRRVRTELRRELADRQEAEQKTARSLEIQSLLAEILKRSLQPVNLSQLLEDILDLVLNVPWLGIESRGCILLVDEKQNRLVMRAQRKCAADRTLACPASLSMDDVLQRSRAQDGHHSQWSGPEGGGSLIVPIRFGTRILGAIQLCIRQGRTWDRQEEQFLRMLADTLAGIIRRKQKDELLKKQAIILDQIHDAVVTTDLDGQITTWNLGADRLFGHRRGDIIGRHFSVLLPDVAGEFAADELTALRTGTGWRESSVTMLKATGETFEANLSLSLLRDESTAVVGMAAYAIDVSAGKRAERALRASEERFRALVETTSDWVWELNREAVYTYTSPQVFASLGYRPEEVLGKTPFDFMTAEEAARNAEMFEKYVIQGESFENLETTRIRKDGLLVVLETSGVPFFDDNGALLGYRGINRDITNRKLAARALEESEQKHRALMEHASDAIVVATLDGSIVEVNRGAELLLGYTKDELLRMSVREIHPLSESDNLQAAFKEMVEQGTSLHEHAVVTKDGMITTVEVAGTLIRYGGKKVALGIFRNIAERKEAEQRLREAKETLELRVEERTAELVQNNRQLVAEISDRKKAEQAVRQALSALQSQKFALDQHSIVAVTDKAGRINYANEKFCALSQYTAEELLGNDHRILSSGRHPKAFFRDMWRVIGRGHVWNGDICNRAKDGSLYWVKTTIVPFTDDRGKPYEYVAIRTDITERVHAEELQRERERRLERQHETLLLIAKDVMPRNVALEDALRQVTELVSETLEVACAAVWLYDQQSGTLRREDVYSQRDRGHDAGAEVLLERHPQFLQRLQSSRVMAFDDVAGDPSMRGLLAEYSDLDQVRSLLSAPVRMGGALIGWVCVDHRASARHWHTDEQNFVTAVADVVALTLEQNRRRIAEVRLAEFAGQLQAVNLELDTALVKSQEAVRVKSQFLATMSHEIRTPMNGILGMLSLMEDTELDEEQRSYISTAQRSGHVLLDQLNDILDFSRLEAGRMELDDAVFDIRGTLESVVTLMKPYARQKDIGLQWDSGSGVPCLVCGDATRLRQVLTNLISNAVKFTAEGIVELSATVLGEQDNGVLLQFVVSDTGIGIAEENHQRIFEAFTQADGSITRTHGGSGLGLSICKGIVERMGGRLGVCSAPGAGSAFWFTVPLGIVAEQPVLA